MVRQFPGCGQPTLGVLERVKLAGGRCVAEQYPEADRNWNISMIPLRDFLVDSLSRKYAWMLLAVAAFVVLMACANVAHLQFARISGRAREIAVRCGH